MDIAGRDLNGWAEKVRGICRQVRARHLRHTSAVPWSVQWPEMINIHMHTQNVPGGDAGTRAPAEEQQQSCTVHRGLLLDGKNRKRKKDTSGRDPEG